MKKTKIKLDDIERRILVKLLYEKRNELIREGRYTDAIDELILSTTAFSWGNPKPL